VELMHNSSRAGPCAQTAGPAGQAPAALRI
jgi:hypothetical protein